MPLTSTRARRGLALAGVLAATTLVAPVAAAAGTEDGLWYYETTGLAEVHQRTTGAGVEIALIDGPINPQTADLVGTQLTVREPSYCAAEKGGPALPAAITSEEARHTTSMASLLVGSGAGVAGSPGVKGVAPGASLRVYSQLIDTDRGEACPRPGSGTGGGVAAFHDAVADGADIIVVTGATSVQTTDLIDALDAGAIVVASGGNDGSQVSGVPATYNGVIATGTTGADGAVDAGSAVGEQLGVVAPGARLRSMDPTYSYYGVTTGSSNSAAYTAGVLALAKSAFPDATTNQILQALVRTTDGSEHEPTRDNWRGYGAVDVRTLLSVDPAGYPDTNPFVSDAEDAYPSAEELGAATTEEPTAEPSEEPAAAEPPTDDAATDESTGISPVLVGVVAAAVVIVAAAVVAAVLVSRRRRAASSTTNQSQQQFGGHHG